MVFELLIGFFRETGNYCSNSIDMVDYLRVTVKTPICSIGVIVTPARDDLAGGHTRSKDEKFLHCLVFLNHFVPLCTFDSKTMPNGLNAKAILS